jgi:hypothetical protein
MGKTLAIFSNFARRLEIYWMVMIVSEDIGTHFRGKELQFLVLV